MGLCSGCHSRCPGRGGGGAAQVVESGGGMVPRAGLRGRGPRGSLGEGQHPSSVSRGTPSHPLLFNISPLPQMRSQLPSSALRALHIHPLAEILPPPPLLPPFSCPECPAGPRPELLLWAWVPHSLGLKSTALSSSTWPTPALPHLLRDPESDSSSQKCWCPLHSAQASALIPSSYLWA